MYGLIFYCFGRNMTFVYRIQTLFLSVPSESMANKYFGVCHSLRRNFMGVVYDRDRRAIVTL